MTKGFGLGIVVGAIAVWFWRDSIRDYLENNMEPAKGKVDRMLRTVQERSEGLLDGAKEQLSSRLETAREKLRPAAATPASDR